MTTGKNKRTVEKNRTVMSFEINCNFRSRTRQVFISQIVKQIFKTFDVLRCSHSFFKSLINHQFFGNMSIDNYSFLILW